jgi:hypothetical protein
VDVQDDTLVLQASPIGPNEFRIGNSSVFLSRVTPGENVMVQGLGARRIGLPLVAPLSLVSDPPEDVSVEPLLAVEARDGLWGVKDVREYLRRQQERGYVSPAADALSGPFTVAAAAAKGDARTVVVSSMDFASDEVAFARGLVPTAEGVALVNLNPGNVALFVNALHWLAGNTQWMNLGRPIDTRVIDIAEGPTLKFVKVLSYGIWPALALLSGGIIWMVRRR